MKWILGLFGGPAGWFSALIAFVVEHWKLILAIVAIASFTAYVFNRGDTHGAARVQVKWDKDTAARLAKEKRVEDERIRVNEDLARQVAGIEAKAHQEAQKREAEYRALEKRMRTYVQAHAGDTASIGDDGLQLLVDTVRARHPSTPRRDGGGPGGVPRAP